MYLRNKDTNLKDITADDLFGLLTYLNGKQYLDKDYFSHNHPTLGEVSSFDAYGTEVLAELKKTYN